MNVRMALALGFLALVAIWAYTSFEYVTEQERVGPSGEAARNQFLALTRLIERMGLDARSAQTYTDVEEVPAGATLILPSGRQGYTQPRIERLRNWLLNGGHLIVEANGVTGDDAVLSELRIGRKAVGGKNGRDNAATVRFGDAKALQVDIFPALELLDEGGGRTRFVQQDEAGTIVLHLDYGRGRITVLPALLFATNEFIGRHDNAAFAWELVQLGPAPALVVIAPMLERPSLFAWLWANARVPLFAGTLALVLWLWRSGVRFGPLEPEPGRERRRLLEHLRASGRFLWRSNAAGRLLTAARDTALQRVARARPGLAELTPEDRIVRLAELTGLPVREVERAWMGEPDTPASFTAAIRTLQSIDEKLTRKPTA